MPKFAPVLILLALAGAASADVIVRATAPNGRILVMHDTPCSKSTAEAPRGLVELLAPDGAQMFAGCYAFNRTDGVVEVLWDDGDTSAIPISALAPRKPVGLTI